MIMYADGSGSGRVCVVIGTTLKNGVYDKFYSSDTHNESEWYSLIHALTLLTCREKFTSDKDVIIYMDSQLVVNQFNEKWKCRQYHLKKLAKIAWEKAELLAIRGFNIQVNWVPREKNVAGWYLDKVK